ncbi:methyltransferase family protein [Gemmatirosa kalamazoonensis]|uniref:methyltransferase family protein n=1 Tax=Gemmatirosa kalamazoonensis TaxID=861299 RepID=UPI00046D5DC6|nr:methyltransferase [Gemmatirosa kalamazoonensis]
MTSKALARVVADAVLIGACIGAGARTVAWPRAWTLLAVMLVVRAWSVAAVRLAHPTLLRERARLPIHRDQPRADRLLVAAVLALGFLALPAVAAADAARWRLLAPVPAGVAVVGLTAFAAGWVIKGLALRANAFAVAEVRVQRERHAVVTSGVYGVVRHPFYAADPLIFVGQALWLGSWTAAALAVAPTALVVVRLVLEERLLRRELPGYTAYAARVRHRLVPGVW